MIYKNYCYAKERTHQNKTYWKCTQYCKTHCLARCHTVDDVVRYEFENHNHEPDTISIASREIVLDIKREASTTMNSTSQIIANSVKTISPLVSSSLPPLQCIKRTIQRKRRNQSHAPNNPSNLNELIIPDPYTRTFNNELFLQLDNREANRTIIFATDRNLCLLRTNLNWFCDGTFKVCPNLFHQLYTVNIIINGSMIPIIYALMSTRNRHSYDFLFNFILSKIENNSPSTITIDFEKAAIASIQRVFPSANIHGCFFHFNQSIWKKIQSFPSILQQYNLDEAFKLNLRMLVALAFVPLENVVPAYFHLLSTAFYTENAANLEEFLNYFSHTWIGVYSGNNQVSPPLFRRDVWNCFSRIQTNLPLTNNQIEGWHHGLNRMVNSSHPSIWTFIDKIREQTSLSDLELNQVLSGIQVRKPKRFFVEKYSRIRRICLSYNQENISSYLTQIAYNISF